MNEEDIKELVEILRGTSNAEMTRRKYLIKFTRLRLKAEHLRLKALGLDQRR